MHSFMTICIAHCVENEFSFVFNVEYYWRIFVYHLNTAIEAYFPVKRRSINARNKKKKAYPKNIDKCSVAKVYIGSDGVRLKILAISKLIKHTLSDGLRL